MRRLSIIDPAGGWQPLYNEDRSLVLVANAEVYNFVELRRELEAGGHRFATHSDCEVILHLYEERGDGCVDRLRGMFAFALWDCRRQRLLLARDRMGEKPLYLYEQPGRLAFASELKALLRGGVAPFKLEPASLDLYFHYGYVPEPATALQDVRKLPPACTLSVEIGPWRVRQCCYWDMEDTPALDGDPVERIRAELETVGELTLRADVPVGVALSGGLDSSVVAALAARRYAGRLHAFSVGYPGRPSYDERSGAAALADRLGLAFHDVELPTEEMVEFFPELNYHRDDPIADIAGYGYYAVMRAARDAGVPVVLQGQGGDELFWGYPWVAQCVSECERKTAALAGKPQCPGGPTADRMVFYDRVPCFQAALAEARDLYAADFTTSLKDADPLDLFTFRDPRPAANVRLTRLICQTYLLENGIAQGDRLGMACSVELRLPLVDYRLVETVIGLRKLQADHLLPPKAWLKAAVRDLLPEEILSRPKQGFAPPLKTWHRALFSKYGSNLCDGYLVQAGVLRPEAGVRLAGGPFPQGVVVPLSFKALVLESWCRQMSTAAERSQNESKTDAHCAVCV